MPRPISRIEGVVKERGRLDVGRRADCASKPEAAPKLCEVSLSPLDDLCFPFTGLASSAVGGTLR